MTYGFVRVDFCKKLPQANLWSPPCGFGHILAAGGKDMAKSGDAVTSPINQPPVKSYRGWRVTSKFCGNERVLFFAKPSTPMRLVRHPILRAVNAGVRFRRDKMIQFLASKVRILGHFMSSNAVSDHVMARFAAQLSPSPAPPGLRPPPCRGWAKPEPQTDMNPVSGLTHRVVRKSEPGHLVLSWTTLTGAVEPYNGRDEAPESALADANQETS